MYESPHQLLVCPPPPPLRSHLPPTAGVRFCCCFLLLLPSYVCYFVARVAGRWAGGGRRWGQAGLGRVRVGGFACRAPAIPGVVVFRHFFRKTDAFGVSLQEM